MAVGSAAISISHTQINDWSATLANYQPLSANLTQLSGGTNALAISSGVGGGYFADVVSGDAIFRWGAPYTEYVRLGVMSSSAGSNASSLWFSANSAGSNYSFYSPSFVENGVALSSKYLQSNQSISLTGAVTGSGTTSIPTSFANTHLAGINQDLTTTSSPTFATVTANLTGHASLDIPLTGSSAITGSLVPQDANYYNLGTTVKPWYSISASTAYVDHLALAGPLSVKYAIYSTNVARTLDPSYLTMFVYTVSQTTTQTLQDGTISGETITVKNAQNSSTLVLTGNINAGSSTITSLSTAALVWNGSTWY